ncbi:MAG: RsmE family RNA methyltransferase [Nitriliruptoraceae bacterium]
MSLTPFVYVDAPLAQCTPNDTVTLSDDAWKHVTTVLRLKTGMPVIVSDGAGVSVEATIGTAKTVTIDAPASWLAPDVPAITLVQSIPKPRKLDTVVRLATEAGVDTLQTVATSRSGAKLTDVTQPKLWARLAAIADAAGEQARRAKRLTLAQPVPFDELFDTLNGMPCLLVDPAGGGFTAGVTALFEQIDRYGTLAVLIGPEGGFSGPERALAKANGAVVVRLGTAVMRTEHAGMAAVSAAMVLCGRFET